MAYEPSLPLMISSRKTLDGGALHMSLKTPKSVPSKIIVEGETARVILSTGGEAYIDATDAPLVSGYRWLRLDINGHVYAGRWVREAGKQRIILMHRAITGAQKGKIVDHKDRCGLNNRRANLRIATYTLNAANSRLYKSNTTGFKGVTFSKKKRKFVAKIEIGAITKHIGYYDTAAEAGAAFAAEAVRLHGEFWRAG
jgi:hypothetical protein